MDEKACERVTTFLAGFEATTNGWVLNVIDWKLDPANNIGTLTYQTRNDAYAPVFDHQFPILVEHTKLSPPNRSKNWQWNEFSASWVNRKTGERVKVY